MRAIAPTLALLVTLGCSRSEPADAERDRASDPMAGASAQGLSLETIGSIHDRAGLRFAQARLLRAEDPGDLPFDVYLAPMIVQEALADGSPGAAEPGEVVPGGGGQAHVIAGRPTVYYLHSTARLGESEREQLAFLWWYPDAREGALQAQGVRMTLGPGGVPILWEVLTDPSGAHLVFASETLEELARQHHGEPLPGRRYGLEAPLADAPSVVVARAISNGATPMGPFVYLEAGTRAARTLLCRCSPAEYDTLAGETLFRLVDLASLGGIGLEKVSWTPELPRVEGSAQAPPHPASAPDWLARSLRLPPGL